MIIPGAADLDWYCVRARRQKEVACATLLGVKSVEIFLPMLTKWKKPLARNGRREQYDVVMCPPYLFAGFRRAQENWAALMTCRLVDELLCDEAGKPLRANCQQMAQFIARASDASIASRTRQKHTYKPGDVVRVISGPFAGRTVTLSQIKGKAGIFLGSLFGATNMPIQIALEALESAA